MATIAIALFTWTLWRATTGLLETANRQAKDNLRAIKASEQSAEAATISARAAKKSANTLQALERAYVFIEEIRLTGQKPQLNVGQNWCSVTIKNHGRTQGIINCIERWVQVYNNTPEVKIGDCVHEKGGITPNIETIISSEQKIFIGTGFWLDEDELSAVISDSQRLLCLGIIKYKDIFGKFHKTGFCWWYEPLDTKEFQILDHPNNYHT